MWLPHRCAISRTAARHSTANGKLRLNRRLLLVIAAAKALEGHIHMLQVRIVVR
jgi:hypothetical protein